MCGLWALGGVVVAEAVREGGVQRLKLARVLFVGRVAVVGAVVAESLALEVGPVEVGRSAGLARCGSHGSTC